MSYGILLLRLVVGGAFILCGVDGSSVRPLLREELGALPRVSLLDGDCWEGSSLRGSGPVGERRAAQSDHGESGTGIGP